MQGDSELILRDGTLHVPEGGDASRSVDGEGTVGRVAHGVGDAVEVMTGEHEGALVTVTGYVGRDVQGWERVVMLARDAHGDTVEIPSSATGESIPPVFFFDVREV